MSEFQNIQISKFKVAQHRNCRESKNILTVKYKAKLKLLLSFSELQPHLFIDLFLSIVLRKDFRRDLKILWTNSGQKRSELLRGLCILMNPERAK